MAVVKINAIEVPPGAGEELERRFAARRGTVDRAPGFLGFQLLRPVAGESRYFVYTKWESDEAYQAWAAGPAKAAHASGASTPSTGTENTHASTGHGAGPGVPGRPASGASLLEFEVVLEAAPRSGLAGADQ
jgi:heme-degrading monooxygenase HmoA